jgi:hypothetical protein
VPPLVNAIRSLKRPLGLVVATAAVVGAIISAVAVASAERRCESYKQSFGGSPPTIYRVTISAMGISCHEAERIIQQWQSGRGVKVHNRSGPLNATYWTLKRWPGWRCDEGAGGGEVVDGVLDGHLRDEDLLECPALSRYRWITVIPASPTTTSTQT